MVRKCPAMRSSGVVIFISSYSVPGLAYFSACCASNERGVNTLPFHHISLCISLWSPVSPTYALFSLMAERGRGREKSRILTARSLKLAPLAGQLAPSKYQSQSSLSPTSSRPTGKKHGSGGVPGLSKLMLDNIRVCGAARDCCVSWHQRHWLCWQTLCSLSQLLRRGYLPSSPLTWNPGRKDLDLVRRPQRRVIDPEQNRVHRLQAYIPR